MQHNEQREIILLDSPPDQVEFQLEGSHSVGMGKALVCKGKYYWGRFGDKEFLLKIALFLLEDFDSCAEKRLCMEYFSRSTNPTAIKDCMELIECLSGLLSTYDALWV